MTFGLCGSFYIHVARSLFFFPAHLLFTVVMSHYCSQLCKVAKPYHSLGVVTPWKCATLAKSGCSKWLWHKRGSIITPGSLTQHSRQPVCSLKNDRWWCLHRPPLTLIWVEKGTDFILLTIYRITLALHFTAAMSPCVCVYLCHLGFNCGYTHPRLVSVEYGGQKLEQLKK